MLMSPITVESVVCRMGRMTNCGLDAMGYVMAGTTFFALVLLSKTYRRTSTVATVQAKIYLVPTYSTLVYLLNTNKFL